MFFFQTFIFPLSVSFPKCPTLIFLLQQGTFAHIRHMYSYYRSKRRDRLSTNTIYRSDQLLFNHAYLRPCRTHPQCPRHEKWAKEVRNCGGSVGRGTALDTGGSRARFPTLSPNFLIGVILAAALLPWGWLSLWEKWIPGYLLGVNPYPTAFPYGNGMVLHFYQQQESSTTKTVHKVINKGLKTYV